jgi:superfamily II DNA or RNA helicase
MRSELHDHQKLAKDLIKASLMRGHRRPLLQAPTGAGKTVLAAALVEGALEKGNRVAFTVPRLSLIDQTRDRFVEEGIPPSAIGVIQRDHPETDPSRPIQVCSLQTLRRRQLPDVKMVIVDEAHEKSEFLTSWMGLPEWQSVPFVGLTATPWAKGLAKLYDDLLIPTTTAELIEKGLLSRFKVFAPSHPDLTKVEVVKGDYHEGQLSEVMSKKELTADVVKTWLEKGEDRPTLAFCVDLAHARKLADEFNSRGVNCGYVDAYTDRRARNELGEAFRARHVQVICSVGTLTTGIDWDVRCIILARPTKSEILYVQIIGRGLRTGVGKDHCLARGTHVLTNKGSVEIQNITLDHKVWDGQAFVKHSGAICRGIQPVMTYDGLTATADHKVMTDEGWQAFETAARRGGRIVRTGICGQPIRFFENSVPESSRFVLSIKGGGVLRALQSAAHGLVLQFRKTARNNGLSSLQWSQAGYCSTMAICAVSGPARSLSELLVIFFRKIRRSWDRISFPRTERSSSLGGGQSWNSEQADAIGSDRQQRSLRAGEFAVGCSGSAVKQHQESKRDEAKQIHSISEESSRSQICGQDINPADENSNRQANYGEMASSFMQAQREVWDILNSGPLQRFTANGCLVHNCLILDHSDTTLKLGFVTDIHHGELDDGQANRSSKASVAEEKKPRECPSCKALKNTHVCPSCGFAPQRQSQLKVRDGELVELDFRKGKKPIGEPQSVYSGLLWYGQRQGYKPGWAAMQYRNAFGRWPDGLVKTPLPATNDQIQWIKSRQIAFAKGRANAENIRNR